MTRCKSCKKSIKQPRGLSWNVGVCKRCWNKNHYKKLEKKPIEQKPPKNHIDLYLDYFVLREMKDIDN